MRVRCPWIDLPIEFGPWESVYTRFSRWSVQGIYEKVFEALRDDFDSINVSLDSSTVRAHQHAHGAVKKKAIKK